MAGELVCVDHLEVLLLLDCPMDWTWFLDTHTPEVSQLWKQHTRLNVALIFIKRCW